MAQKPTKHKGTCRWFCPRLRYGFIGRNNHETDIYVRDIDIQKNHVLETGVQVEFEIRQLKHDRIKAVNVRTITNFKKPIKINARCKDKGNYWRRPIANKPQNANKPQDKPKPNPNPSPNQSPNQSQQKQPIIQETEDEIDFDRKEPESDDLDEATAKQLRGAVQISERSLVLYRGKGGDDQLSECNTGEGFVKEWLKRIFRQNPHQYNAENYFVKLVNEGFDDMESIATMDDHDLQYVGIDKLGHRRRILRAIQAFLKT